MKELILAWMNKPKQKPTVEEVEVQVWAFVVRSITAMVFMIALGVMYAIAFEPQEATLAPIDAIFLEILKAVAYMSIGTLGGIAGRKISKKAIECLVKSGAFDEFGADRATMFAGIALGFALR